MKHTVVFGFAMFVFGVAQAADTVTREELVQKIGLALADGQCSAVLMKEGRTSAAPGRYISDASKLHQCQYVQEMIVSPCVTLNTCPSYAVWSKNHPDFSPSLPRDEFEKMLDMRQRMVAELRKVRSNLGQQVSELSLERLK